MLRSSAFGLLPFLLVACSSDAGAPTLDTGIPRDTQADQVTPAQAQTSCQAYEDLANQALGADVQRRVACTITGIVSQLSGGATCSTATVSCLADAPAGVPIDFNCELATTFAPSGCTATIGELEDCVNAVSRDIDAFTSSVTCSLASDPNAAVDLAAKATAIVDPSSNPACVNLSAECIGLLGWTATATPAVPTM